MQVWHTLQKIANLAESFDIFIESFFFLCLKFTCGSLFVCIEIIQHLFFKRRLKGCLFVCFCQIYKKNCFLTSGVWVGFSHLINTWGTLSTVEAPALYSLPTWGDPIHLCAMAVWNLSTVPCWLEGARRHGYTNDTAGREWASWVAALIQPIKANRPRSI